jgi:hypothetical protein
VATDLNLTPVSPRFDRCREAAALHHLDAPWRPADIEQREGRIIRQGNQNAEVEVIRYVTEGSFDTYMCLVDRTIRSTTCWLVGATIVRNTVSARGRDHRLERGSVGQRGVHA